MKELTVDPEFRKLIPPLSDSELQLLTESICAKGCEIPLVVWDETNILLDGHNRYNICVAHDIEFGVSRVNLPDRDAAELLMLHAQLGRRNLNTEDTRRLWGRVYATVKRQGKRSDKTSAQIEQKLNTADRLAEEFGVAPITVRRAGAYVKAIDTLKEKYDIDVDEVLAKPRQGLTTQAARATSREEALAILTPTKEVEPPNESEPHVPKKRIRPCIGMHFARVAIKKLAEIRKQDLERKQALNLVEEWIHDNR